MPVSKARAACSGSGWPSQARSDNTLAIGYASFCGELCAGCVGRCGRNWASRWRCSTQRRVYSNRPGRWSAIMEHFDLGAECPVLAGRHLPQGRHGQVQGRAAGAASGRAWARATSRKASAKSCGSAPAFSRVSWERLREVRLWVQEKGVD